MHLTTGMQLFAISHEIAHALEGHLHRDSLGSDGQGEVFGPKQELEADYLAANLLVPVTEAYPLRHLVLSGPSVFLRGLILLDECRAKVGASKNAASTHPATLARLQAVEQHILDRIADPWLKAQTSWTFAQIALAFEALSGSILELFTKLNDEGYRAEPDARTAYRRMPEKPAILG